MNAFIDTNLAIALIFYINSLHTKSKEVFEVYSIIFWSNFVKKEYERRSYEKYNHLSEFFNDLQKYFEYPEKEFYSINDLYNFILSNYSGKKMEDAKSSISQFWSRYIGQNSYLHHQDIKKQSKTCLNDLNINTFTNMSKLEKTIQLTSKRTQI